MSQALCTHILTCIDCFRLNVSLPLSLKMFEYLSLSYQIHHAYNQDIKPGTNLVLYDMYAMF